MPEFKDWYLANKPYYEVRFDKNNKVCEEEAMRAYNIINEVIRRPPKQEKRKGKKKKPNPYGFDREEEL